MPVTNNNYFNIETYQHGEHLKQSYEESKNAPNTERKKPVLRRQDTMFVLEQNEGFCASLKSIFTTSDEEIFLRCGDDALQYLRFQRYITCYLTIVMLLSICIILPLNLRGTVLLNYVKLYPGYNVPIINILSILML